MVPREVDLNAMCEWSLIASTQADSHIKISGHVEIALRYACMSTIASFLCIQGAHHMLPTQALGMLM